MLTFLLSLLTYWPRRCHHDWDAINCRPAACRLCGTVKR